MRHVAACRFAETTTGSPKRFAVAGETIASRGKRGLSERHSVRTIAFLMRRN
jgi:hypothetical protein